MTTTTAADIRTTLKAHGWTSRDVSVRSSEYSLGSSITVTIDWANAQDGYAVTLTPS